MHHFWMILPSGGKRARRLDLKKARAKPTWSSLHEPKLGSSVENEIWPKPAHEARFACYTSVMRVPFYHQSQMSFMIGLIGIGGKEFQFHVN